MTPTSIPHLPGVSHGPPPDPVEMDGRWLHEVRNELSTAMMAAAVARRLLQRGEHEAAMLSLHRTESACHRCAQLLTPPDDTRPQ